MTFRRARPVNAAAFLPTAPWGARDIVRAVVPVHDVIPDALVALVRKAALTPEKVAFAWRRAVGPAVDQASAVELRGTVLHVRARDAAWQREIRRSATLITTRLQALLGEEAVRQITVKREGAR